MIQRVAVVEPEQITLGMQISCVEREIKMREHVYPGLIGRGKMSKSEADLQLAAMRAVLATLKGLHA